ncbi:MAG TPA: DUF1810 domain-containing protein, partial [Pyrinomonadaceae bacterium]|nr:DUF1810 domain-containing protein [Pyrinomonadaceae bacterium]
DPFDLNRFLVAQDTGGFSSFDEALSELKNCRKTSHWMWYIFPQVRLGHSEMSVRYAIGGFDEARAFMQHPVLGKRLIECTQAVVACPAADAAEIFGSTDAMKLHSSATLFSLVAEDGSVFHQILTKYFAGKPDQKTLSKLGIGR